MFPRAPPREIVSFAAAHRLPAVYGVRDFEGDGGLMSYDANLKDIWCRAAFYIDKILKGTKIASGKPDWVPDGFASNGFGTAPANTA